MTTSMWLRPAALAVACAISFAGSASAITVGNAGFEAPDTLSFTPGAVDVWTVSGSSGGVFQPAVYPGFGGSTTDPGAVFKAGVVGDQTGYSNGAEFYQTLSTTAAAGDYTLTVAVGDRADLVLPSHTINLRAGSVLIATAAGAANGVRAAEGWSDLVAVGTLSAGSAAIGQNLRIELVNNGGSQINWDDVRLDFVAAIPGPASALLLFSAFGVAGLVRQSRRPTAG